MHNFRYHYSPTPADAVKDLKLYYCGDEDCAPGHSWGPGLKDHFKILYIRRGRGIFRSGDQTYALGEGQGFLLTPEVRSFYQADEQDPWSYSWAAFSGLEARSSLQRAGLSAEQPLFRCREHEPILSAFGQMCVAGRSRDSRDLRLLGALYTLLSILVEEAANAGEGQLASATPQRDSYIQQAVEFFRLNYSRSGLSIESMAQELGLDRKYAGRLFKDSLGVTPQQFLLRLRMEKACELLSAGSLPVSEVAYSVGYKDPLLFSRMFKRVIGSSPLGYRRTLLQR